MKINPVYKVSSTEPGTQYALEKVKIFFITNKNKRPKIKSKFQYQLILINSSILGLGFLAY